MKNTQVTNYLVPHYISHIITKFNLVKILRHALKLQCQYKENIIKLPLFSKIVQTIQFSKEYSKISVLEIPIHRGLLQQ